MKRPLPPARALALALFRCMLYILSHSCTELLREWWWFHRPPDGMHDPLACARAVLNAAPLPCAVAMAWAWGRGVWVGERGQQRRVSSDGAQSPPLVHLRQRLLHARGATPGDEGKGPGNGKRLAANCKGRSQSECRRHDQPAVCGAGDGLRSARQAGRGILHPGACRCAFPPQPHPLTSAKAVAIATPPVGPAWANAEAAARVVDSAAC